MKASHIMSGPEGPAPAFAPEASAAFRELVLEEDFPCLGAKAAFHSESFRIGCYPEIAAAAATSKLSQALLEFTQAEMTSASEFATFIAIFEGPRQTDEREFEQLLWKQLRALHREDLRDFDWNPSVRSAPADPHFSFSFGGQALYVIGMHANSSRHARRFPWPALVFNPHKQFERLRADGKWKRMQETIRKRDEALQGSINPMLSDFGVRSEARQYSGRAVEENWRAPFQATSPGKCPFHP